MGNPAVAGLEAWHLLAGNMTAEGLDELLDENVVFHSPVVHTPQEGRDITKLYLLAAGNVMPGNSKGADGAESKRSLTSPDTKFRYVREVVGDHDAVLEFMTEMDGIVVNGIDMIKWNDAGKIIEFKVLIRPLKAVQKVHAQMGAMLEKLK